MTEIMRARHSVRKYLDKPIPADVREKLDKCDSPYANLLLWLLSHSGIIRFVRTDGRLKIYSAQK